MILRPCRYATASNRGRITCVAVFITLKHFCASPELNKDMWVCVKIVPSEKLRHREVLFCRRHLWGVPGSVINGVVPQRCPGCGAPRAREHAITSCSMAGSGQRAGYVAKVPTSAVAHDQVDAVVVGKGGQACHYMLVA